MGQVHSTKYRRNWKKIWCNLIKIYRTADIQTACSIFSLILSAFQCISSTSHKQSHCIRMHFVQQSTTFPLHQKAFVQSTKILLHQEAFCPTVYNTPIASGNILPNSLQLSHCIRKHSAQQSTTLPLHQEAFCPTAYNIPIISGSILSNSLQHSHCIRKHFVQRSTTPHCIRKHFVQQSTTFPLHQEAFCPTVYNIPIISGSILSNSLQHSHCIRKHSALQSTTPPLHQEAFCPTVYNYPIASGSILPYNYPIASGSILPNSLQHPHCNRKHFVQQSTTIPLHQEAVCPTVYNIPTATGSILPNKLQHAHCIRKHFSNSLQHNKNKLTNTRQPNKCLLEYTGYMFRLVNRSSS